MIYHQFTAMYKTPNMSLSHNATKRVKEDAHANQAALFILKANECLKVSQLALNTMPDDINTLLNVKLHETEHKVLCLLSRKKLPRKQEIFLLVKSHCFQGYIPLITKTSILWIILGLL